MIGGKSYDIFWEEKKSNFRFEDIFFFKLIEIRY